MNDFRLNEDLNASSANPIISRRQMLQIGGTALLGAALPSCATKGGPQTIRFASVLGQPRAKAIAQLIDGFHATHPHIRVEHIPIPWDLSHSKLITMFAGGNAPDVLTVHLQWMSEFRAMGAIENLLPFSNGLDSFVPLTPLAEQSSRLARAMDATGIYGIPLELSVRVMFYQLQWLEELGLKPADTRTQWRALLEKMTDKSLNRYGYAFRGGRAGYSSWWPICEEFAGTNQWFDQDHQCIINSPDHVAGLSYWNDIYQDGLAPKDALNWGYTELVQGFWSGICGCCEQDPEVLATCREHGMDESTLATALMPAGPKARVAIPGIFMLSMPSGSTKKDAAWEFISWASTADRNLAYCREVGIIPPIQQGLQDPMFSKGLYKPFMDMVTDPNILIDWAPNYLPEMGEFLELKTMEEQQKMLLKQQSPQETLDRLADYMTRAQKKYVDKYGPDTPRPPE
jgi:multiple sugar transport system substrate-binding protein